MMYKRVKILKLLFPNLDLNHRKYFNLILNYIT